MEGRSQLCHREVRSSKCSGLKYYPNFNSRDIESGILPSYPVHQFHSSSSSMR